MPLASEELRAKWNDRDEIDDLKAVAYLEDNGFREFGGMWTYPRTRGGYATEEENSALDYLCQEWDYSGFIHRNALAPGQNYLETNQTIFDWCDQTFGPIKSQKINIARTIQEAAELLNAIALEKPVKKIAEEAADIAIVLVRSMEAVRLYERGHYQEPVNYHLMGLMAEAILEKLLVVYRMSEIGYLTIHDFQNYLIGVLETICVCCQSNLYDEICDKMRVNRKRKWAMTGQGTGYHV